MQPEITVPSKCSLMGHVRKLPENFSKNFGIFFYFWSANNWTQNFGNSRIKGQWNGNSRWEFFKNWAYLAWLSSFSEIRENTVSFAAKNFRTFKRNFFLEWKALLVFHCNPLTVTTDYLFPSNLTSAAKCLSSDCHHLFPAKITLGRTCNPRVETFCTNVWHYLNTFHWTLNPGLLTSLFCFLFSFLLGHCRLKTGQRRAMENFTTVTHTLFFMAKRIQTQMFVYSLAIDYYLFIGAGIWVIFNTTSCAAKTAEKIPCKESHGEKYRAIEQKYSTIQDRVVRK